MTEVGAATGRKHGATPAQRRRRELVKRSGRPVEQMWIAFAVSEPVASPSHRIEAGIVLISLLEEDVECPLSPSYDREARRTISQHRLADEVLQHTL
jgi:hypothetical protein